MGSPQLYNNDDAQQNTFCKKEVILSLQYQHTVTT